MARLGAGASAAAASSVLLPPPTVSARSASRAAGAGASHHRLAAMLLLGLALAATTAHAWSSSFVPRQAIHATASRAAGRRSGALQMKIQWDPYTGQFIDVGDDEPIEEIGVPARNKPTGLKPEELKGGGGSVAKANAYLAQQMAEDVVEGVNALMNELDELTVEMGLAPGEIETWPSLSDPMKRVLQTEQQANLETVRRNVDIARASALLVAPGKDKESPLAPALVEALVARGAPAPRVVSADSVPAAELAEASVLILLPEAKEGPKLPFGGGGGGGAMLESHQVEELLTKAAAHGKLRHVVYVSSVGAEKAGFQFTLDSLGGALERKKGVEQAVRRLAKALGFSYSIVRVGALGAAKAGEEAVLLEPADSLAGATALPTAAQAVLQSLALPSALNATFSVVNTKGPAPTDEEWRDGMVKLVGPEVLRMPITADVQDMRMSVRAWALQYMEGERKLTTKVFAVRTPLGAKIYFLPTMNVLGAGFREEKAVERARMKGDGNLGPPKPTRPVLEGGLEVCIDEQPYKRVRVRRVAMEEGTVVKAMSEKELLDSLRREVESVEALAKQGKRVTGGAGD